MKRPTPPTHLGEEPKDKRVLLFLAVTTFLTLGVNGYKYAYSDQAFYIPLIEKSIDPEVFTRDYLFGQLSAKSTLWVSTVALLARWFDLQWIFFIGYLLSLFGFLSATYALAFALFRNRGVAVLAVLLVVPFKPILETQTATFDLFFTLRTTAMPLALGSLASFIAGRWNLAAALCAFCFLLHPITALGPACVLFSYLLLKGRELGWTTSGKASLIFLVLSIPLLVNVLIGTPRLGDASLFARVPSQWMALIRIRNWDIFYSNWHVGTTLRRLMAYVVLFALGVAVKMRASVEQAKDWRAVWVVVVSLFWFGIGYLFVEVYPVPLILRMQVARNLYLLIALSLVCAAYVLWVGFHREEASMLDRFLVIVGIVTLLHGKTLNMLMLGTLVSLLLWVPPTRWFESQKNGATAKAHWFNARAVGLVLLGLILWQARELFWLPMYARLGGIVALAFLLLEGAYRIPLINGTRLQAALRVGIVPALALLVLVIMSQAGWEAAFHQESFRQHLHLPHRLPPSPWRDVQQWIAQNTPSDGVFFVPPDKQGFRIFARRSIVGDWKDGARGLFSEQFAKTWAARMAALYAHEEFNENRWRGLASTYEASFIVTRTGHPLNFPKLYDNGAFSVYRITHITR